MHGAYFRTLMIGMAFALAGVVKGVTGTGWPTVPRGLLGPPMAHRGS